MMNAETKIVIPRRYQAPGQPRRRGIRRSQKPKKYRFTTLEELMEELGITDADLEAVEELEIDYDDVDGYELDS